METSAQHDDAGQAAAHDLASIDAAKREFAGGLVMPWGYDLTAGTAAGLNIAAVGLVCGGGPLWRTVLGVVLIIVSAVALGWSVRRFRNVNGAWVSGLRRGRTLTTSIVGGLVQATLGFTAAFAAVAAGWWWLGLILAPIQVAAFVVVSRRWMTVYRTEHGASA